MKCLFSLKYGIGIKKLKYYSGGLTFLLEERMYFSSGGFIVKFCFTLLWKVNEYKTLKVLLGGGREFLLSPPQVPEALPVTNSSNQ